MGSTDYLRIDGSIGEGGGQILRTSVSAAAITGRPIEVVNIRARRPNPGLRPQHLTAIKVLADLFAAEVENLKPGADWIRFRPSRSFGRGVRKVDVGTAGSIPMILTTVVPAVALSGNSLEIELTGGTDVSASPTTDYLRYVVLEALRCIGLRFRIEVLRRGYYPKGGGIVRAEIDPCPHGPEPMDITTARDFEPKISSVCASLPRHVAERQTTSALLELEKRGLRCRTYSASVETAISPGSSVIVYSAADFGPFVGGDSIGALGKRAESVGAEAAGRFIESAAAGATVDPFLADMLVLPLALARAKSRYRTARASGHLRTNLQVVNMILGSRHAVLPQDDGTSIVEIGG